jgi:hypothetical protein
MGVNLWDIRMKNTHTLKNIKDLMTVVVVLVDLGILL